MIDKELREYLDESEEGTILFDNPSFDKSIIGISTSGSAVYALEYMIQELAEDEDMSEEDAYEFISYNTIRVIPYIRDGQKPVIIDYDFIWEDGRKNDGNIS